MVVLIVEDEAIVALMLEAELGDAGYSVLGPAVTAREAMQLARTTHVDFALLDIKLQDGSSGIDLARHLRSSFGTLSVFISGEAEQAHANRDAAVAYIRKPYEFSTVLAALQIARDVAEDRLFDPDDVPHGLDLFAPPRPVAEAKLPAEHPDHLHHRKQSMRAPQSHPRRRVEIGA